MPEHRLAASRVAALFGVSRPAYFATLVCAGLAALVLWAAFPAALVTSDPLLQMAVIFVAGGVIVAAMGVHRPGPAVFYGLCILPFAAIVSELAVQPGQSYRLLALMAAVFGLVMVRVCRDVHGSIVHALRELSGRKTTDALHEMVEKLRLAVDAADLSYWEWDRDADQLHWGRDPSSLVGSAPAGRTTRWTEYLEMIHPEDREHYLAAVTAAWERTGPCSNEYRVVRPDGRVAWLSSHGKTLADVAGRVHRMIGVTQDITERKRQEDEARYLAYHDTLTGLPNRRLLDDRLRQAVFLAQRREARVALMVVDLDRFKQVNDALGHRAGDAVLREAAHRIAGCLRKADTLARHGGDEFVVVIPDLQLETDCQVVAEKILRSLEPPFRVDGRDFTIGASIGASLYPADADDGEALLRTADAAMYRAKQLGRNNYRFYGR